MLNLIALGCILFTACGSVEAEDYLNNRMNKTENKMIIKQFNNPDFFSCNVYVLSSEKGNILVDPGFYSEDIRQYIKSIGGLDAILLTHGHWDHTKGLDELKADYPSVSIYLNKLDKEFLRDPHLNGSDDKGFSLVLNTDPILIEEGNHSIGGYEIEVIHMPGHTIGSSMYYLKEENILFTGDFLHAEMPTTTFRPTGSDAAQQNSMRRFKSLIFPDDMQVCFGHGKAITYRKMIEIHPCFDRGLKDTSN